jgi:hypothetical protein
MSFDAILGLLAVIFFVVLPLISNAGKRKPPEGEQEAGVPGSPRRPTVAGEPEPQPGGWAAKLEEARRRIEAELAEPAATTTTTRQAAPARPQPLPGPVRSADAGSQRGAQRRPPAARPRPGQPPQLIPPAPARPRPARSSMPEGQPENGGVSDELQITRLGRGGTYNDAHSARTLPDFSSRNSVLNGIIWHQILSEPPHRRRAGRLTSRLRSP